jgi:hypothetical protein
VVALVVEEQPPVARPHKLLFRRWKRFPNPRQPLSRHEPARHRHDCTL